MFKLSKRSKERRAGVDPRLIQINDGALIICPIDFGIPNYGGVRSAKTQNGLFLDGKSGCDGYEKLSKHQLFKALDFYAYVNGKASWEPEHLAIVAAAHLQVACKLGYELEWGGFWKHPVDMPHIQLIG